MRVLTVYAHPNPKSFCHAVLERFTTGLQDAGHVSEVVDLYAIRFDPVFRMRDFASYVDTSIPLDILESMELKKHALETAGGPIQRFVTSLVVRNKDVVGMAKLMRSMMPKDVVGQQEKVARADGLAFIAPVFWLAFPAILKGWFERVFTIGFAYNMSQEGWEGNIGGRIPLLHHQKAVVITTTLFSEENYRGALGQAMKTVIDDFALRYPGIKQVEHVYFYGPGVVDDATRRAYLERAYYLGKEFALTEAPTLATPVPAHRDEPEPALPTS